ncbi:hypothetical protein OXX80_003810 [Metschnikowia pulcherrima]
MLNSIYVTKRKKDINVVPIIFIGFFIAYSTHVPDMERQMFLIKDESEKSRFAEHRLLLLLDLEPFGAFGLFRFPKISSEGFVEKPGASHI